MRPGEVADFQVQMRSISLLCFEGVLEMYGNLSTSAEMDLVREYLASADGYKLWSMMATPRDFVLGVQKFLDSRGAASVQLNQGPGPTKWPGGQI